MAISGNTATQGAPLIALQQLSMTWRPASAERYLAGADAGEVHCLAGTNGCGKSTLIKALAGVYQPDDGSRITIDGQPSVGCRRIRRAPSAFR